jgi:RHS repeat-associated protein
VLLEDGTRKYVWGAGGLAYSVEGTGTGTATVYHSDGLGSVRVLTSRSGVVVQTYEHDEFGVPTQTQGSLTQPFGFTGEPQDPSGLVNLRARVYDPTLGRFLQRDPFGGLASVPAGQQPYAYAHNNPVNLTDPSGEYVETALDLRHDRRGCREIARRAAPAPDCAARSPGRRLVPELQPAAGPLPRLSASACDSTPVNSAAA